MIDRIVLALELTFHVAKPFLILVALGLFAVALKMLLEVGKDLKKDSRPEDAGVWPRPTVARSRDRLRWGTSVGATTSQRGSTEVSVLLLLALGCFALAFYLALGLVAALTTAGVALLLTAGYRASVNESAGK